MSTLSGIQLLEVIGGVDDELVAESLAVFCPVAEGGAPVFMPIRKRPDRVLRAVMALGLAAALLCGVVTVVPFLGGPDLWGGFYGVIAPLLKPDETEIPEESEYECEADPEETTEEPEEAEDDGEPKETVKPKEPSRGDYVAGNPVTFLPSNPGGYDPTPEWPTIDIREPRPETPTVPRPNVPTPGPSPWP